MCQVTIVTISFHEWPSEGNLAFKKFFIRDLLEEEWAVTIWNRKDQVRLNISQLQLLLGMSLRLIGSICSFTLQTN